jgi:hypothetical protein
MVIYFSERDMINTNHLNNASTLLPHDEALALLPFLATGALHGAEREAVDVHVQTCVTCRRELINEKRTQQAFQQTETVNSMAHSSYQRLATQLDALAPLPSPQLRAMPTRRVRAPWFATALAASLVALMLGGAAYLKVVPDAAPTLYRTLALGDTNRYRLMSDAQVAFKVTLAPAHARAVLEAHGLEVLSGPNAIGVFSVRAKSATRDLDEVLATLRAQPAIAMAYRTTR